MKKLLQVIVVLLLGIGAGIAVDRMLLIQQEDQEPEREILYWVAPMDSTYRRDQPGKSPMGMDLVPVYADVEPSATALTS